MVVQWLAFCAFTAGEVGLISGRELKSCKQAAWPRNKKKVNTGNEMAGGS